MSLFYRFAYRIGLTPWERMSSLPIAGQIAALLDREQEERPHPLGRALDLGCGSGIWTVDLARRGWQVTGIDIVPAALAAARRRIDAADVDARLVQGDMARMREAGVGDGHDFVLDFGAIHGLHDAQRQAVARELDAVTTPGATLLLLAWQPGLRGPLPRGIGRDALRALLPSWSLVAEAAADTTGAPGPIRRAAPQFYRFRRT